VDYGRRKATSVRGRRSGAGILGRRTRTFEWRACRTLPVETFADLKAVEQLNGWFVWRPGIPGVAESWVMVLLEEIRMVAGCTSTAGTKTVPSGGCSSDEPRDGHGEWPVPEASVAERT